MNCEIIRQLIERNGAYLIADDTLDEIENGFIGVYEGEKYKTFPCLGVFNKFLDEGFAVRPCSVSGHKLIVSIK